MSEPSGEEEAMKRTDDTLRRMLKTPPKPHKDEKRPKPRKAKDARKPKED